jgi:hypothetical protein
VNALKKNLVTRFFVVTNGVKDVDKKAEVDTGDLSRLFLFKGLFISLDILT